MRNTILILTINVKTFESVSFRNTWFPVNGVIFRDDYIKIVYFTEPQFIELYFIELHFIQVKTV